MRGKSSQAKAKAVRGTEASKQQKKKSTVEQERTVLYILLTWKLEKNVRSLVHSLIHSANIPQHLLCGTGHAQSWKHDQRAMCGTSPPGEYCLTKETDVWPSNSLHGRAIFE